MKVRFQADADLNRRIVVGVRRREPTIDLRSAREADVAGRSDPEVLLLAAQDGRVLVSHDRRSMPGHFARFIENRASPGLIIVSQSLDTGEAIEELLLIWAATEAEEWRNAMGFVPL